MKSWDKQNILGNLKYNVYMQVKHTLIEHSK